MLIADRTFFEIRSPYMAVSGVLGSSGLLVSLPLVMVGSVNAFNIDLTGKL